MKWLEDVAIGRTSGKIRKTSKNGWWSQEINEARHERKRVNRECRDLRKRRARGEVISEETYDDAWKRYKSQQKRVKTLIKNARAKHEDKVLKSMRDRGEEGSKEWFRYLRGDKVNSKVE